MLSRSKRVKSFDVASPSSALLPEFTANHVYDIRSAVVCMLNAIGSFVESQSISAPESYINIAQQMYNLDEKLFQGLRDRYLWWSSTFAEYNDISKLSRKLSPSAKPSVQTTSHHGFAIKYSRVEADRFLQCLLVGFEACRDVLLQTLKRKSEKETHLFQQAFTLKEEVQKLEIELRICNDKLDHAKREKTSWINKFEEMNQSLAAANEKVSELEKKSDALRWQQFSDDIAAKHASAVERLTSKFEAKEKEQLEGKENLKNKIKKLESDLARSRLRNEVALSQSSTVVMEKLDFARQQLYLRNQEITILHKHLVDQQRAAVGCLHGLQEDYKALLNNTERENPGKAFSPNPESVKYQAKLRLIGDACLNGTLHDASSTLPTHYAPTTHECKTPIRKPKMRSLAPFSKVSAVTPSSNTKPRSISVFVKSPNSDARRDQLTLSHRNKGTAALPQKNLLLNRNLTNSDTGSRNNQHPLLVNPTSGRADMFQVLKHFPYLSEEQVTKQWENFRKYDKNKDLSLDLPELYEVITDVWGLKVTVSEMKEAMNAVDRDRSNNVDFYEYLKIAEMIIKMQGKAAIFQSEKLLERGTTASDACVLQ